MTKETILTMNGTVQSAHGGIRTQLFAVLLKPHQEEP